MARTPQKTYQPIRYPILFAAEQISVRRGERLLLKEISFSLRPGEALQVTGENGSGKTTLLRILAGLSEPDRGRVTWHSEDIRDCRDLFHHSLTFSGHHFGLRSDLTARENLDFLLPHALSGNRLTEVMEQVGLARCVDLPARYLSQGQRRRLLLARLIAQNSELWVLDEPLAALDRKGIELVEQICTNHLADAGMLVVTSHQPIPSSLGRLTELSL